MLFSELREIKMISLASQVHVGTQKFDTTDPNHRWLLNKIENWNTIVRQYFNTYDPEHWLSRDRRILAKNLVLF